MSTEAGWPMDCPVVSHSIIETSTNN